MVALLKAGLLKVSQWCWCRGLALVAFAALLVFLVLQGVLAWQVRIAELFKPGARVQRAAGALPIAPTSPYPLP